MITLLLIIWVICKIVDYYEDREDDREYTRYIRNLSEGDEQDGDNYDIYVDARQIHFHNYDYSQLNDDDFEDYEND